MNKYLSPLLLLLSACATNEVAMSDAEVSDYMNKNPQLLESIRANGEAGMRYKHRYYDCSEGKDKCVKIDCIGVQAVQCWKSPMSEEDKAQHFVQKPTVASSELTQMYKTCLNEIQMPKLKRDSCHNFIRQSFSTGDLKELVKAFEALCTDNSVACTINNAPSNKGTSRSVLMKRDLVNYQFDIKLNGKRDSYGYSYYQ